MAPRTIDSAYLKGKLNVLWGPKYLCSILLLLLFFILHYGRNQKLERPKIAKRTPPVLTWKWDIELAFSGVAMDPNVE